MTCEAQGLGKVVGLVLGVGLGSGVDATSRPLQRGWQCWGMWGREEWAGKGWDESLWYLRAREGK